MEKLTVPGNPRLMELIRQAAERGSLGQAFLLSGPGDKSAAARYLAAALECTGESPPCCACRDLRQAPSARKRGQPSTPPGDPFVEITSRRKRRRKISSPVF